MPNLKPDSGLVVQFASLLEEVQWSSGLGSALAEERKRLPGVMQDLTLDEGIKKAIADQVLPEGDQELSISEVSQVTDSLIEVVESGSFVGLLPDWEVDLKSDVARAVVLAHQQKHRISDLNDDEFATLCGEYRNLLNW